MSIEEDKVQAMYDKPGIYVMFALGLQFFILESEGGRVHQCKPEPPYEHDGELSKRGWNYKRILALLGPFERPHDVN